MAVSIRERLAEFYRRLLAAPPAESADVAFVQISAFLDEVEDALSGIPKCSPPPSLTMFDGRMYPPLPDHVQRLPDGGIVAVTRGHIIEIGARGGIVITNKVTSQVEFSK